MIARLPYWVLTNPYPSIHDSDSKTTVEMTSKVYAKMQELIDDYNKFVDNINKHIEEYETSLNQDFDCFKAEINKIIHDYIATLDLKIQHQDRVISESIVYIKENIEDGVTQVLNDMKESGELDETILEVFNELDTIVDGLNTTVSEINNRVAILENSKVKMVYDSQNEILEFKNVDEEVI